MRRLLTLVLLLFFITACSETIEIGWVGALSGDSIASGAGAKAAVELAVEELNTQGGINGQEIVILYEDGGCDRKKGEAAAERLVEMAVPAIIGAGCSSATLGIADATRETGTVVISPSSSSPAITDAGEHVFRTYPSDTNQGFYAAKLTKDSGVEKIAILHCENVWCTGLRDVYKAEFEAMGGTVVAEKEYLMSTRDLSTELELIQKQGVDGIYFISYQEAAIVGLKAVEVMDWDIKVFGADTWDSPIIPREAGTAAEGRRFTYAYAPMSEAFKRKIEAKGATPVIGTAQAYDNMYLIAKVMNEGALTSQDIAAALLEMPEYQGESGPITFDENGDLENAVYAIGTYSGGRVVKPK
ncbi:amino acid ABC transporter substrate-binding protein [Candidatus Woesearchaeota archaeon]|nr:amino acid ABC transporter substrate-binding protein [Candidatus Woesearchaeota archaeon]